MVWGERSTTFEDIEKGHDVTAHIGVGGVQRISDTHLGGEVNDVLKALLREERLNSGFVSQLDPFKGKGTLGVFCLLDRKVDSVRLQSDIIVVVEIVYADNILSSRDEPL